MPVFWWMRLDLVFLVSRTTSGGVFWGVCDLIMILGSLSANGWGFLPVLLWLLLLLCMFCIFLSTISVIGVLVSVLLVSVSHLYSLVFISSFFFNS